jgi:hypothetical protein
LVHHRPLGCRRCRLFPTLKLRDQQVFDFKQKISLDPILALSLARAVRPPGTDIKKR